VAKIIKEASTHAVFEGLMNAVKARGLSPDRAIEVFEAALEEMRSDLHLCSLSRETPISESQLKSRSRRHEHDFGRFLESGALYSDAMVRIVYRHLQMEMSDQLHILHDGRPISGMAYAF
jgi:hypothetical protein